MKRTFPLFLNLSSAVLHSLTAIPKIGQHGVYASLQGLIALSDFITHLKVSSHFAKFLKLPVKIENQCGVGRSSCHSRTLGMHSYNIKSSAGHAKTEIIVLGVTAHSMVPLGCIGFVKKLQLPPQEVLKFNFRSNLCLGKDGNKRFENIVGKIISTDISL